MKLVYAVDKNGYNDPNHIGVRKKVTAVLKLFNKNGIESSLYQYEWINGFPMLEVDVDTDVLYFRRIEPSLKFIYKLFKIRCKNRKIRIIMEIPTYPFAGEKKKELSWKRKISYGAGQSVLRFFLDRIVLIGQEKKIPSLYGVPIIHANNGVDYESLSACSNYKKENEIHMIAVSGCYFWHGYDRLINGMKNYYMKNNTKHKVYFHLVGEGDCLDEYKNLSKEKDLLNKYVFFYGNLEGEKLDEVYDKCDVAIDCLGCHRKQLYYVSSLKVREYAAKGLPMVTSTIVDINCEKLSEYILELPTDESDIEIKEIIKFTEALYSRDNQLALTIREEFKPYCEWNYSFQSVLEYIKEGK